MSILETGITSVNDQDEDLAGQDDEKKKKPPAVAFSRLNSAQLVASQGEVIESEDTIILEAVPIITPNRDIVVSSLSFEVGEMLNSYNNDMILLSEIYHNYNFEIG